ncbi:MAG: hypothetical protein IJ620_05295, partial [Bacteroidales bacterium]|nr:hypothetical protein [Bacteroidales bacterium]
GLHDSISTQSPLSTINHRTSLIRHTATHHHHSPHHGQPTAYPFISITEMPQLPTTQQKPIHSLYNKTCLNTTTTT